MIEEQRGLSPVKVAVGLLVTFLLTSAVILVGIAAFTIGENSEPGAPAPREFYSSPEPVEPQAPSRVETGLETLHQVNPDFYGVPDSLIKRVGRQVCSTLDTGVTVEELIAALASDPSLDPEMAGQMIGFGIMVYCPEYQGQIDGTVV
jgi:hypothetical protein